MHTETIRNRPAVRALAAVAAGAFALAALAGCSQAAAPDPSGSVGAPASEGGSTNTGLEGVTVVDPWIKATDGEMTGMFGTIVNETDKDLTIVSIEVPGAGMVQMHETVVEADGSSSMKEVQGGFTVPAGGELRLEPGADHIMLMKLEQPIKPGDELTATITLDSGEKLTVTAQAKEYTGGQESYAPGHTEDGGHGDHDHGDHDHDHGHDDGHGHDH